MIMMHLSSRKPSPKELVSGLVVPVPVRAATLRRRRGAALVALPVGVHQKMEAQFKRVWEFPACDIAHNRGR